MPMVRTDGRASGRSVSVNLVPKALFPGFGGGAGKRGRVWVGVPSRDYQISRMGRLQHFLSYGAPLAPRVELMLLPSLVLVFKMCLRHWSGTSFLSYPLPPRFPPKETPVSAPDMAQRKNKEKSTQCNTTGSRGF